MGEENDEGKEPKKDDKEVVGLKRRLDKHQGDAMALAAELIAENTDLNRQLSAARSNKPKEGSLVLSPEDTKQWNALIALGKPEEVMTAYQSYKEHGTPDEVKTKLTEHASLTTENAQLKKVEQLRQVADSGIGGKKLKVSVLETLDKNAGGLTYEERDATITENGKTRTEKQWHVKDNNKWVPLAEYSDTHWKDFGPALLAEAPAAQSGTRVVGQVASDQSQTPSIYDKIRQDANDRNKKAQQETIPLEKRLGQQVVTA